MGMMNPYEMKGAGMGMMNPYEMKAEENMMSGMPGMDMGGAPAPSGPAPTDMLLTAEEMTALADAVSERLLEKLEDINLKMARVDEELKTRGYARTKEISETTEALEKLVEHAEATQDEIDALRAMNDELLSRTEQVEQEWNALQESRTSRIKSINDDYYYECVVSKGDNISLIRSVDCVDVEPQPQQAWEKFPTFESCWKTGDRQYNLLLTG
jgi:hypothetical protein